jgi:hypothetical protein
VIARATVSIFVLLAFASQTEASRQTPPKCGTLAKIGQANDAQISTAVLERNIFQSLGDALTVSDSKLRQAAIESIERSMHEYITRADVDPNELDKFIWELLFDLNSKTKMEKQSAVPLLVLLSEAPASKVTTRNRNLATILLFKDDIWNEKLFQQVKKIQDELEAAVDLRSAAKSKDDVYSQMLYGMSISALAPAEYGRTVNRQATFKTVEAKLKTNLQEVLQKPRSNQRKQLWEQLKKDFKEYLKLSSVFPDNFDETIWSSLVDARDEFRKNENAAAILQMIADTTDLEMPQRNIILAMAFLVTIRPDDEARYQKLREFDGTVRALFDKNSDDPSWDRITRTILGPAIEDAIRAHEDYRKESKPN